MNKLTIKLEDTLYPDNHQYIDKAVRIANGILYNIQQYGWYTGERNDMSVDWLISTRILGIDNNTAKDYILDWFQECEINVGIINTSDSYDFLERYWTIIDYIQDWINRADNMDVSILVYCCNIWQEIAWADHAKSDSGWEDLIIVSDLPKESEQE